MAYKLDRVYETDGTELSNALHTTTLATANQMEYDGRYLWVTCSGGIGIYEFWGAASDNEPPFETLDELLYPRYDSGLKKKLRLVTFITVSSTQIKRTTCLAPQAETGATTYTQASGETAYAKVTTRTGTSLSPYWIKKCANKMYVTSGATFGKIFEFSIDTQNLLAEIDVQETHVGVTNEFFTNGTKYNMLSNLESANTKLWFAGQCFSDNAAQKLYSYDVLTGARTTTDIPVRPQLQRIWIANGYNGSVYITNYNNVSVTRFSDTGVFGATIRMNAFPSYIWGGPDRRIWASSYGGMLTLIDFDDDGAHNNWGTDGAGGVPSSRAVAFQIDPTDGSKMWFIDSSKLARQDLNTGLRIEQGIANDWEFSSPKLTTPTNLWISPASTYLDASLSSVVLKNYMFCLVGSKLIAWRLDRYLYREVYASMMGSGAVVESPLQYFGES